MQETARLVAATLPPGTGFIVFAFDIGAGGRIEYLANAERKSCVRLLREWIAKTEQGFATHVDPHDMNPTSNQIYLFEASRACSKTHAQLSSVDTSFLPLMNGRTWP